MVCSLDRLLFRCSLRVLRPVFGPSRHQPESRCGAGDAVLRERPYSGVIDVAGMDANGVQTIQQSEACSYHHVWHDTALLPSKQNQRHAVGSVSSCSVARGGSHGTRSADPSLHPLAAHASLGGGRAPANDVGFEREAGLSRVESANAGEEGGARATGTRKESCKIATAPPKDIYPTIPRQHLDSRLVQNLRPSRIPSLGACCRT